MRLCKLTHTADILSASASSFPFGKLEADVAVCFAGFVQFLLSNKNCTRAADEFYLADKGFPPALSATPFALLQNATQVGRFDAGAVLLAGYGRPSPYIIPACFPVHRNFFILFRFIIPLCYLS